MWSHPGSKPLGGYQPTGFILPPTRTRASRGNLTLKTITSDQPLPDNFAWHPNLLTPVRDQQNCGACWAFAITSSVADRVSVQTNGRTMVPLSVQHLLNCVQSTTSSPCDGNDVGVALSSLPSDGFVPESDQPYLDGAGTTQKRPCLLDPNGYQVHIQTQKSYILTGSDRDENIRNMKAHIYTEGPIIGVMTDVYPDFADYDGTSVYEPASGQSSLGGHGIEIAGWGKTPSGVDYWICRNSWGPNWPANHLDGMGEGWFYIKMGVCGIEEYAYAAIPVMANLENVPPPSGDDSFPDDDDTPGPTPPEPTPPEPTPPEPTPPGPTPPGPGWGWVVGAGLLLILILVLLRRI